MNILVHKVKKYGDCCFAASPIRVELLMFAAASASLGQRLKLHAEKSISNPLQTTTPHQYENLEPRLFYMTSSPVNFNSISNQQLDRKKDFPEVINSIVVVNIPTLLTSAWFGCHSKTIDLTACHFFKRSLMADVGIGPLSSSSCSEGYTFRCVSWCSSFKISWSSSIRLDLLKYIAGRDWGADAGTLRLTYTSLIRPVLEYGSQIYFSASRTNLAKLDRVQSSAARIITGMRHSCPTDLVLLEADIMPLDLRRKLLLSKYFCKLYSYGDYNRTSAYLITWTNRHRLKRDSPFSRMQAMDLLDQDIEEHFLKNVFNPQEGLPRVHFKPEMGAHTSKIKIHLNIYVN
ncbi:uncharacterized protein TNCV_4108891 [Trichonephila clavipes]|nr:uncharacterized protein TNCV_4108891 [Trichonephila clavipes]